MSARGGMCREWLRTSVCPRSSSALGLCPEWHCPLLGRRGSAAVTGGWCPDSAQKILGGNAKRGQLWCDPAVSKRQNHEVLNATERYIHIGALNLTGVSWIFSKVNFLPKELQLWFFWRNKIGRERVEKWSRSESSKPGIIKLNEICLLAHRRD